MAGFGPQQTTSTYGSYMFVLTFHKRGSPEIIVVGLGDPYVSM